MHGTRFLRSDDILLPDGADSGKPAGLHFVVHHAQSSLCPEWAFSYLLGIDKMMNRIAAGVRSGLPDLSQFEAVSKFFQAG